MLGEKCNAPLNVPNITDQEEERGALLGKGGAVSRPEKTLSDKGPSAFREVCDGEDCGGRRLSLAKSRPGGFSS